MLEATKYARIYGQQQLGKCLRVAGSQPTWKKFRCKNYVHVKYFSYVFFVRKHCYNKIKRITVEGFNKDTSNKILSDCLTTARRNNTFSWSKQSKKGGYKCCASLQK